MPVRPPNSTAQSLFGSKRSRDGPGSSCFAEWSTAASSSKKVKLNEIKAATAETSENLQRRDKNWQELCAKLKEYKKKAKGRDHW